MSAKTLADWGERGWIETLLSLLDEPAGKDLPVPIGDDAAVWSPPIGKNLVLTSDAQIEGTHFKKDWLDWAGLARRVLLAAASDVTAMGGRPLGILLSLGAPSNTLVTDLESFARTLAGICRDWNLTLLGGDTIRSDRVFVDVTCVGEVEPGHELRQAGAQPGDSLWVTGILGGMNAAWRAWEDPRPDEEAIRERFWNPPVRWPLIDTLRDRFEIRALTDLSDGLRQDLQKVLTTGGLGAEVFLENLPVDPSVREYSSHRMLDPLPLAYNGGEDFELLIVVAGSPSLEDCVDCEGIAVTRIGRVLDAPSGVSTLLNGELKEVPNTSFEHF